MSEKNPNDVAQDAPDAESKAEGYKLEWGPDFDLILMTWKDVQTKITELNASLPNGEKFWRLPTSDELQTESKKRILTVQRGFMGGDYWCSSDASAYGQNRHSTIRMYDGEYGVSEEKNSHMVRLVRDVT